jgi:hypothetical protein
MDDNSEQQLAESDDMQAPLKKSHRWLWLIVGVGLVLVLGAAAFLGGRYLQYGSLSSGGGNGATLLSSGESGGSVRRQFSNNELIPAPELPKTAPDVNGVFVRRQNNSFFVGTGQLQSGSSSGGPVVEVVVTNSTKVYRDDTLVSATDLPSNGAKIQQKVVPGNLDDIGQDSLIHAWGNKTGERLITDVLLYNNAIPNIPPGPGVKGAVGK